jgi:Zn ribbon nucleic-acid-binding protein
MKLFGTCIWHKWWYIEKYFDCSDVCIWSSGTEYYRQCVHCGVTQKKKYYETDFHDTHDKEIKQYFKEEKQ